MGNKYKVGDKFIIEIAEVSKGAESGNTKYRVKGFDNLIFDDRGLDRLIKYTYRDQFAIGTYVKFSPVNAVKDAYEWVANNVESKVDIARYTPDLNYYGVGVKKLGQVIVVDNSYAYVRCGDEQCCVVSLSHLERDYMRERLENETK